MYSLMVVDDEQIVLDAVQFIVEKHMDNVAVVATARSGREALEKVDDAKPDIMLVDIQMPVINGLEVIGRVMEQYKSIEFIVISAYEEFAFAKEALSLGVREYILKPINRYKLVNSIERAIGDIEKKRNLRRQEIDNRERIDRMMPILEQSFIYSVLLDKNFAMDIPELMETFNLSHDWGYIMIIECDHDRGKIDHYIIRDTLKLRCQCIIGPFIMNRSIVFVSSEKGIDEERENRLSADLAKYTISTIEKKADVKLRIGIGGYREIENLSASYDEAIRALQSQKGGRIIHIMDVTHDSADGFQVIRGKHRDLLSYIESGDIEETDRLLDEFIYSLYGRYIKIEASNSSSEDGVRNAFAELW